MSDLWVDPRPERYAAAAAADRSGRLDDAAAEYRRLSRLWPGHRRAVRYNLASVLVRQGREGRAGRLFAGLADNPAAPGALRASSHFHLGRIAEARGRLSAARDHYRSALVLAPDHGQARASLTAIGSRGDDSAAPLPSAPCRGRDRTGERPVLIWQMGKVGLTSLMLGLRHALPDVEVHHSHALAEAALVRSEQWLADNPAIPPSLAASIRQEMVDARRLRARLLGDGPRWRILTVTREPIGHLVSVLFHHLELYARLSGAPESPTARVDALHAFAIDVLTRWVDRGGAPHEEPARGSLTLAQRWFDRELAAVLGLDVTATPVARDRGCTRMATPRADVVVVRFEDLAWAGADAVHALCGIDAFALPAENRGQDRASGGLYADYLRRCRFPAALVEAAYATAYAVHFYTGPERRALAARWC